MSKPTKQEQKKNSNFVEQKKNEILEIRQQQPNETKILLFSSCECKEQRILNLKQKNNTQTQTHSLK